MRVMALRHKISFTAEGLDRVDAGGAPARVNGGENREGEGHDKDLGDLMPIQLRGQGFQVVNCRVEEGCAGDFLHELFDLLDIGTEDHAEPEADKCAENADRGAAHQEYS